MGSTGGGGRGENLARGSKNESKERKGCNHVEYWH